MSTGDDNGAIASVDAADTGATAPLPVVEGVPEQSPPGVESPHRNEGYSEPAPSPADRGPDGMVGDPVSGGFLSDTAQLARRHLRGADWAWLYQRSEVVMTVAAVLLLFLAAAVHDGFDAEEMWPLFTWLIVAFTLSRGIAKLGTDRHPDRPDRAAIRAR